MAIGKRITSEDLTLNLILNIDKVNKPNKKLQQEMFALDREIDKLEQDYRKLALQQNTVNRQFKNGEISAQSYKAEIKKLNAEMLKTKTAIEQKRAALMQMQMQAGATARTINQLRGYLATLKIARDNALDPGVVKKYNAEIQRTNLLLERKITGMSRISQAWRHLGSMANRYGTAIGMISMVVYGIGRAIFATAKNFRELDKQYSNVMKTSGLTREQVAQLKEEFDQLNAVTGKTPTSTMKLLDIARVAGKLGVEGKDNIKAFTLAVDKLYVALGEDLDASVEEVAEKVGKLVNVFNLDKELGLEEAMLRAGSLINELDKRSAASASTILNYTSRLGGVGSMAKFTIDQLAGMGAALDAMGVPAERGSTAVVKLITSLGTQAEEFARILGWTTEEYKKRVAEDANGVLKLMLEASSMGNQGIMQVLEGMDEMDVSGVRMAETYGKLVQNMDMLTQQQEVARVAFQSSASVMNEFYIMSKDYDSLMALQGKRVKALADDYSKALSPAMYKIYKGIIDLAYGMRDLFGWIGKTINIWAGLIALLAIFKAQKIGLVIQDIVVSMYVWVKTTYASITAMTIQNATLIVMKDAYIAAGGGIKGATAAMKAFGAAMVKNPYTAVVAGILLVAGAVLLLWQRTSETTKALEEFDKQMATETYKLNQTFEALKKTKEGTAERENAIKLTNERYGEYMKNLMDEKASLDEITTAQQNANKQLQQKIALQFREGKVAELLAENQEKIYKKMSRFYDNVLKDKGAATMGIAMYEADQVIKQVAALEKAGNSMGAQNTSMAFAQKWSNPSAGLEISNIDAVIRNSAKLYNELNTETKILTEATAAWETAAGKLNGGNGGTDPWIGESETDFEAKKKMMEMQLNIRKTNILNSVKDKEKADKQIEAAELSHLQKLLTETENHYRNKEGIITSGEAEIAELALQVAEKRRAMLDGGNKKENKNAEKQMKNELLQYEVILLKSMDKGTINKEMYDRLMLQMEEDYWKGMLGKVEKGSDDYNNYLKNYYETRAKIKENNDKNVNFWGEAFDMVKPEKEEAYSPKVQGAMDDYISKLKKLRKILGFENLQGQPDIEDPDSAEVSRVAGIFEGEDYALQLQTLEELYANKIGLEDEYLRKKEEIEAAQHNAQLERWQQGIGAFDDMLGALGNLYSAQKERELKLAGDNEEKKLAIQKKYAKKEQAIATGQALIAGALSIMRIWESKATGILPIDAILKGVMTAAMVVTTGMQIAAIKAQQFASGNYPVIGADDGRTYNASYVGRPRTGIYNKPSLGLFAEKPEMVIDNPTLRNIQLNNPALIQAIMANRAGGVRSSEFKVQSSKIPQFAEGNYPVQTVPVMDNETALLLTVAINNLMRWKPKVYTELIKKDLETLNNIDKKREL